MPDISSSAGNLVGSQRVAGITVNTTGKVSRTTHQTNLTPASGAHDGDYHGQFAVSLTGMSTKYDDRFDDVGYYP
jgi:hypothetical protein